MQTQPLTADIDNKILIEQLRMLYDAQPLSVIANVLNAGILAYTLQSHVSNQILVAWLFVILIIVLYRIVTFSFYKHKKDWHEKPRSYLIAFNIGTVASAIGWGMTSVVLFVPAEITYQVFLAFVIAGMSAGAVTSLSFLRLPIYTFLSFTLIPLITRLFNEGGDINVSMGVMVSLFFLILLSTATRTYSRVRENILLRIQADFNEKVIRESEEKYRSIFDAAPVGILQYDLSGQVIDGNDGALRILSCNPDEIRGINFLSLDADKDFVRAVKNSLNGDFSQYVGNANLFFPNVDLAVRMYFKALKTHDGSVGGGVAIFEDISEQLRVERLKTEFVSTVSHELRTPLTAIKGSIGLIETVPEENKPALIDVLKRNSDRLVLLINDLLDMEKIVGGNMSFHYQNWDVMELVSQSVNDNQGYASEHKTEIILENNNPDAVICVDRDRFNQIMANLLSNAAKFTRSGTSISVFVKKNENNILINVKDHGEGIPESFKEKLFDRFTQADSSTTRKKGGTGLGLYITKQLVDSMGGDISCQSGPEEGTIFTVSFPIVIPQA